MSAALLQLAAPSEALTASARPGSQPTAKAFQHTITWPPGTDTLQFENVEGIILIRARMIGAPLGPERVQSHPVAPGGADTTGWLALDTGAGFLALDSRVALRLGVLDSLPRTSVDFAPRPLPRLEIGDLTADQVAPVVVFDASLLDQVTDHHVLGLLGYRVIRDRIVRIDYGSNQLALVPAGEGADEVDALAVAASRRSLAGVLSPAAIPSRFRMTADGKIMLQARFTPNHGGRATSWLNVVLDTGASKTTLFEDLVKDSHVDSWSPSIKGLLAPTLLATSRARLCRVRQIEIRGTSGMTTEAQTEVALLRNPIARQLGEAAGVTIHGLLGYSFLERFRVSCDYPRRVLWLDPIPNYRDPRPYEHSHVGLQLARDRGTVRIVSVVEGSPAALAGIAPGDMVVAVNGKSLQETNWEGISHALEGPAGTAIDLTIRRGTTEKTYHLRRRRLL